MYNLASSMPYHGETQLGWSLRHSSGYGSVLVMNMILTLRISRIRSRGDSAGLVTPREFSEPTPCSSEQSFTPLNDLVSQSFHMILISNTEWVLSRLAGDWLNSRSDQPS